MTYAEFRKTYHWALKTYPGIGNLPLGDYFDQQIGKVNTSHYHKSGSRWVLDSTERKDVTTRHYCNCVDAVPFFRGLGGSERIEMAYTVRGYLPIKISSISPDKQAKTVREFQLF